jgi:hypothetical protein
MPCKALGGQALPDLDSVLGSALQGPYSGFCPQALLYTQKNLFWTLWASLLHGTHVVWPREKPNLFGSL